jgi:hypothetical protein
MLSRIFQAFSSLSIRWPLYMSSGAAGASVPVTSRVCEHLAVRIEMARELFLMGGISNPEQPSIERNQHYVIAETHHFFWFDGLQTWNRRYVR